MTNLFNLSFAAYILALLIAAIALFVRPRAVERCAIAVLAVGSLFQTAYIIVRWIEADRAPFSNMFESLVLFAWAIVVVFLYVRMRLKLRILSVAAALLAVLTLAYASAFKSDIKPLMPALQSNWLSVHVFTCFLGYGGFAISFVTAIIYLIGRTRFVKWGAETLASVETVTTKTISFGFMFLTLGIITGAVWADYAWGTYWSWDPKETWSLVTWLVYAFFLHCSYVRGWGGNRAAWISIVGFGCVIFTYVGVNFLLAGLHSYAK